MKRGRCILNRRPGPNDRSRSRGLAVLLCALLLALAPAINLSAPVGMRAEPEIIATPRKSGLTTKPTKEKAALRRLHILERAMRFELTTPTLARLCSTPELRPHPGQPTVPIGTTRL